MLFNLDSFTGYDENTIVENGGKFDNWLIESDPPEEVQIDGSYGRNGGAGLQVITNSNTIGSRGHVSRYLPANYDTVIIGAAVRVESRSSSTSSELHFNNDKVIFSLLDGAETQVCLCLTPSMRLRVRQRGRSGLEIGRSSFYLHEGVYYYLEFMASIAASGSFTVRVDGVSRLTGSGNTKYTPNAFANGIRLGARSDVADSVAGRHIRYDDLYVAAVVVGTEYNTFIGDIMVEGRTATSMGPSAQWSPSSGTLHHLLIDDVTPNTTDYIRAGTVGYVDTFAYSAVTVSSGSVLAVQPNLYARKLTSGVVQIAPVMSRQGTVTVADDENYLSQDYRNYDSNLWTKRPSDEEQWPLTFTDDHFFGVKRTG